MTDHIRAIGIMSGTSGDGIDIAYVSFDFSGNQVKWQLHHAATHPFSVTWKKQLSLLTDQTVPKLLAIDRAFGKLLGDSARQHWTQARLPSPDLIAAHGYSVYHSPKSGVSHQLGHGATLAGAAGVPAVVDFRAADLAYGGQGAPFAPMGDEVLFPGYQAYLNLGGIANIYFPRQQLGYDVTGCNLLLNALAAMAGQPYDLDGRLAAGGEVQDALLQQLMNWPYHQLSAPKSLHAGDVMAHLWPLLKDAPFTLADRLQTVAAWVGKSIGDAGTKQGYASTDRLLVTGGGTHHPDVVRQLTNTWPGEVVIPMKEWIDFKEAILFAYFGAMRWRGETFTRKELTGATQNTIGGAVYLP